MDVHKCIQDIPQLIGRTRVKERNNAADNIWVL